MITKEQKTKKTRNNFVDCLKLKTGNCSRFSPESQELSDKGLFSTKDLFEVSKLLIFWIQKGRAECDVLVYLCLCSYYEKTTKKLFEKKFHSSTQFVNEAIETLFLLEKVRTAQEEIQFSNSSELVKLKSQLSFCYTNLVILKEIQLPELKDHFTIETDKAKRARYNRIIKEGPSGHDLQGSQNSLHVWLDFLVWLRFQLKNKSTLSIDQTKISLVFFHDLHDRRFSFDIYTLPTNLSEHFEK